MREKDWSDCLEFGKSFRITPDIEKAKSLLETAEERIRQTAKEIKEENVNFVFEDYYSSIIEIIHGIISVDGYKVLNHVCLGNYLRDVMKKDDLFIVFDDLRFKRNSLTYYGKKMDFETGKDAVEKSKRLVKELTAIIKNRFAENMKTI